MAPRSLNAPSAQNVFSRECVLFRIKSHHSNEMLRQHYLKKMAYMIGGGAECVLYRMCSLQNQKMTYMIGDVTK